MNREQSKAVRYIQLLDQTRCNGDWDAVPELVRKVRKHAPQRTCLTLTAECEHTVSQAQTSSIRSSSTNGPNASSLGHLIGPLSEAIENEKSYPEDEFQAKVCLGWLHWVRAELDLACSSLPSSIEQSFSQLDGVTESVGWIKVCAVKATYIKGTSLVKKGAPAEAFDTFEAALPMLSTISTKSTTGNKELHMWTELLLTQSCVLSSQAINLKSPSTLENGPLSAFRAWTRFWEHSQASSPLGGYAPYSEISRRQIWKAYYTILSTILQQEAPVPDALMAPASNNLSTESQLQAELQRVESRYEDLLLREVQFPKADQTCDEVEEWVNLVVQNWTVLCGSSWQDQSRRVIASRRVLDILYRAATKTFHSTAILRHLFTVHLGVGEFDLAFKAFDTYLEIVKKGKARVEKTGEVEKNFDSDEIVLRTVSECIRALCRYGSREASERARDLAQYSEEWLNKRHSETPNGNHVNMSENGAPTVYEDTSQVISPISPEVFAAVWRSIGIAKAQWARVTYEAGIRSDLQVQAAKSLRRALSPEYSSVNEVETLFALAMVLSERRELNAAVEVVKMALLPPSKPSVGILRHQGPSDTRFAREKSLIPLWHLLALLLSARQEFAIALRACEGAFEQFQDPKNLFGDTQLPGTYRSEHLNAGEKPSPQSKGIVDEMDDFQKETVLEVKMTQLALIEVLEGPDVAVNASDELLSLYSRLFGEPRQIVTPAPQTAQTIPQSSAGTLRSIKGSLFGRSRPSVRQSSVNRGRISPVNEKSTFPARPMTSQTYTTTNTAPTIHVTNENGGSTGHTHHHEKLHKRRSASLSRKKSQSSVRNRSTSEGPVRTENRLLSAGEVTESHAGESLNVADFNQIGRAISPEDSSIALSATRNAPQDLSAKHIPPTSQDMPQNEKGVLSPSLNAQHDSRQQHIISRSSLTSPYTRFPKDQERRRRTEILVRVWLLIAGFYRRAEMFEDAKGAIDEAYKLVERQEMDVAKDTSGNVTIHDGGWGSTKSVEELWGDVWSERGYLSIAKELPYTALSDFEASLTHFADHPSAIVGLSNILLDVYTETLPAAPSYPAMGSTNPINTASQSTLSTSVSRQDAPSSFTAMSATSATLTALQNGPLGLSNRNETSIPLSPLKSETTDPTGLLDRLAARDRAHGLLTGLTKRGSGWNYSEAWLTLARAHEESGLVDNARDALWWCVELEEGRGVRNWRCVGAGGYVL